MSRRLTLLCGLAVGAVLLALWLSGASEVVATHAAAAQKTAQNAMAGALRGLRAHRPGALAGLIGLAFAYGVVHAVGPGHGKVLIGGYGVARRVRMGRLAAIALASSLAQATAAVALVYGGVFVLDLTRERMVGLAERVLAPASQVAIGLIGVWLAVRGLSRLWSGLRVGRAADHEHAGRGREPAHAHGRGHDGVGHVHDAQCGHRHGPTVAEVARATTLRDAAVLIGGIAMRPCTGALFLLILCWRMGIDAVGIAGAYAMGLGTALVTVAVAGLAVWAREGAFEALSRAPVTRALPLVEIGAGIAVIAVSADMLRHAG